MSNRWKTISKDFIYNIIASLVLTGIMQIVVYPFLALYFDAQEYGIILTLMGIANAIAVTLGNTLNNVRLIMNTKYDEEEQQGDFNLLLIVAIVVAVIITEISGKIVFKQNTQNLIGIGLFIGLLIYRSYHCVAYRIVLNFKLMLIANIVSAFGFLIGIVATYFLHIWSIAFVFGELFYVLFLLVSTKLYKEPYVFTSNIKDTLNKYLVLIVAGLAGNFLTYLDRLIIYPLLGGEAVSIYTVASVLGKSLGLIMTPIAGVLLGYYTQKNFRMSRKLFWKINGITLLFSTLFMLCAWIFAPLVLKLLYPGLYKSALPYLFWANLAATLGVTCTLTQSAVLKFAPTWIQVLKEGAYAVVYIVGGLFLLNHFGLMGFCIAALAANVVRLLVLYVVGNKYIK